MATLGAIIQARMTSTRLPGKVLMEVLGRPLLSYQLERLRHVKGIKIIVVATTTNPEDDPVVELCQKEGVSSFRGSEHDVLDRYLQVAKVFSIDPILRITADCPLLDVGVVEQLIETFALGAYDFVHTGPSFAEGFDAEIFSFAILRLAWENATKPLEREHATLYLHNHPERCRKYTLVNATDDSRFRVTVDEPQDFEVVKTVMEAFYPKNPYFTGKDVKQFLTTHPEVASLNSHIIRNDGLLKSLAVEGGIT